MELLLLLLAGCIITIVFIVLATFLSVVLENKINELKLKEDEQP